MSVILGLPKHDDGELAIQPHRVIATWLEGTFVENIALSAVGDIYCTAHPKELYRVSGGKVDIFARLPEGPNGIAIDAEGAIWLNSGAGFGPPKQNSVWRVGADGSVEKWVTIEEATFLNGMTMHPDGRVLTVDSRSGGIYAIDRGERRWSVWFKSEDLKPAADAPGPGGNGIKIFRGALYASVTNRARIVRIGIGAKGEATTLATVAEQLICDDFAIDGAGRFYLTTHPMNTLVLMSPDGLVRKKIAGPEQGMVGATACAFGVREGDRDALYVTTEGGVLSQYEGKLQRAKLVRVDVSHAAELLKVR
jgi:sugar lactone lactonase YvrE